MFYTDSEILAIIGQFALSGIVLGFLYDILRFIRTAFATGAVFAFITDFFAMIFSGLVLMLLSVDTPTGRLRLIYILSAAFGMILYLITIGRLTAFLAGAVAKLVFCLRNSAKKFVFNPIYRFFRFIKQKSTSVFDRLHKKMKIYKEKSDFGLKKGLSLLYNKNNNKMSKLCQNGGEERNVIKAKIRKKA